MTCSIVIPTYNRPELLERCIQSALAQSETASEIIVVDDCSPNRETEKLCQKFPMVQYVRQDQNRGPGPARNRGVQVAKGNWVIPVDDDDELLGDAVGTVRTHVAELERHSSAPYSVVQFGITNSPSDLGQDYRLLTIDDFIHDRIHGTFPPVLHRKQFLAAGFAYPETRIGGESVLWWEVAKQHGIPTWQKPIMQYNDDAGAVRLTDFRNQVRRANEYAQLQEMFLTQHGDLLQAHAPRQFHKRLLGAAVYWLLAGEAERAKPYLQQLRGHTSTAKAAAFHVLPWLPASVVRQAFLLYRDMTAGRHLKRPRVAA